MAVSTVQLNFRVPEELYKKLEAKADATGNSKTEIIRQGTRSLFNQSVNATGRKARKGANSMNDRIALLIPFTGSKQGYVSWQNTKRAGH